MRARNMKSPVSQTNVIVSAARVIVIGGLPPSARTVSRRCQTAGGCGARIVMRWTAGSMPASLHERVFVCVGEPEGLPERRRIIDGATTRKPQGHRLAVGDDHIGAVLADRGV